MTTAIARDADPKPAPATKESAATSGLADALYATLRALGLNVRGSSNLPVVNGDTALRHSAVWACLRLRADLRTMGDFNRVHPLPGSSADTRTARWLRPTSVSTPT